ncbi:MAG TPA: ornithine cyclodeaminase family protein [Gemmatimonadaceae bacterium]|nr:ornithine cyclodeaminase family protein [Gemmatimonadaceae bacterium]
MNQTTPTRLLTRSDVASVLPMADCIAAIEAAFRAHADGRTLAPGVLGTHAPGGGFHVKTAGLTTTRGYFAAKINANFPSNPKERGLPTIQGALILFDATDGRPLAIMDSAEITRIRTAAASAVAAKYMSRTDSAVVTICGCGLQGRAHLEAMIAVRPVREVHAWDIVPEAAARFAEEMALSSGLPVAAVATLSTGTLASDMIVTCTSSTRAFLTMADVRPGTFIAAVGADSAHKQEIDPDILKRSTVVADILEQCALIGDLQHAFNTGVMTRADVHAELADVVAGRKPGRHRRDEITVFDSTGTALEDVAAAALAYEKATGTASIDLTH